MRERVLDDMKNKPEWLKIRPIYGETYQEVKRLIKESNLHTVCEEANCPNISECFSARTATFMILGDTCTRTCKFCNVNKGKPKWFDKDEPRRVGEACARLDLRFAVITSVARDDLADGGASIFAETTRQIKAQNPKCRVELLIPDLKGNWEALQTILDSNPDVLAHNLETVPRLYPTVRPEGIYGRSLELLARSHEYRPDIIAKSGIMAGLGETEAEYYQLFADAAKHNCQILTIGQYLRPSYWHHPVVEYRSPDWFAMMKENGEALGIPYIESGPLVRSSYLAHKQVAGYHHRLNKLAMIRQRIAI